MNETDPRVKRTRKLLLDAFMGLLAEKRFHDISVQDIAERATVNRATFYAHFVDKYALQDEVVSEWFRQTVTSRVSPSAPFTRENLLLLIEAVLEAQAQFQNRCQHQGPEQDLGVAMGVKVQRELSSFVRRWLEWSPAFRAQPAATREAVASALSWSIFGAGTEWQQSEQEARDGSVPTAHERATQLVAAISGRIAAVMDAVLAAG